MRRVIFLFICLVMTVVPALAEEFVLKDGTKIVGHMTAIKGEKIEIETAYGKMQIRRSGILTINFPENSGIAGAQPSKTASARPIDESLTGTDYVNRTGHFTLTVPVGWKLHSELRVAANALAAISSHDGMRFVLVERESFSGSLDSYKGLVEVQRRRIFTDYEKLSESSVAVDGLPAVLVTFRGINPQATQLPLQFVSLMAVVNGESILAVAWCPEPLFNESQRTLEGILLSYKRQGLPAGPPEPNSSAKKPSARRVAVDRDVEFTKLVERVEPPYPPLARQTRIQGTVHLHAILAADGSVEELEVISGHPLLVQSALDAVRKWRFLPTTVNGQPVEVDTTIDVIYALEENKPSAGE
jgi:TonB family protein